MSNKLTLVCHRVNHRVKQQQQQQQRQVNFFFDIISNRKFEI
jgi:hypothetical protein